MMSNVILYISPHSARWVAIVTYRYESMITIMNLTKIDDIPCKNTFGVKKVRPSKVESYLKVNT